MKFAHSGRGTRTRTQTCGFGDHRANHWHYTPIYNRFIILAYFVLYYNENAEGEDSYEWSANKNDLKTKEECEALSVKEVVYRAPNAFEFSITGTHYIIISIFVAVVAGYFVYRFVRLTKEYKHIEDNFKKTGTIEFNT